MIDTIIHFDQIIITQMALLHSDIFNIVMISLTQLWDFWLIWLLLIAMMLILRLYRSIGYIFLSSMILNIVLWEWILKHIFHRLRPFQELTDIVLLIPDPITSSFPSGHSSASWCFAILFSYFFWKRSQLSVIIIWIVALWVTLSRLYLQVHYPSDILGGILVGISSASITIFFYQKLHTKL